MEEYAGPGRRQASSYWQGQVDQKLQFMIEKFDDLVKVREQQHLENQKRLDSFETKLAELISWRAWVMGICATISVIVSAFWHSVIEWFKK